MAFAYIALGVPAVLLWWNIALHLRRLAPARRSVFPVTAPAAGLPPAAGLGLWPEEAVEAA